MKKAFLNDWWRPPKNARLMQSPTMVLTVRSNIQWVMSQMTKVFVRISSYDPTEKLGIDLQKLVHEDMKANFSIYPKNWGLTRTDKNIDHRRVPNLQRFFERKGESLPKSRKAQDYHAGALVTWMLPGNLPHIGIVSDHKVQGTARLMILHNIGQGPKEDDILFEFPITGHYKYVGIISNRP